MPLETLAMAASLLLSLVSRHFVMFFAGVAVPPVSRSLVVLGGRISSARHSLLRPLTSQWAALLAGVTFIFPAAITPPEQHPFQTATRFLTEHSLERPIFNVPASGGLATWVGGPELMPLAYLRPRSIEAFEQETAARRLAQIFEEHELDVALVDREFAEQERDQIAEIQELKLLFFDDVALLYARVPSSPGPLSDISFHYFDPLKAPPDYPPETVPLAIQELFAHYDRYPPSPTTLRKLGALLLRAERREEALEAFEASQRLDPKDLGTLRALSRLYIDKGMYGLAEKSARQALRLTRDEEFTYNLALALYGQGRYADAARQFESVLELNADNLKARRALVDLYRQLGQLEQSYLQKRTLDAMEEFKTAAMLTKAQERSDALDFEGAARFYVQALEISRDQPEILWDLAMVLLTDNRVDAATIVLRNLIDVAPRHTVARLTLGVLCARESTCTTEEAKAHLEAFLALAPDDLNAELAKQELEKLE
jgi:tetratricopeptide (TPR) repeat protein